MHPWPTVALLVAAATAQGAPSTDPYTRGDTDAAARAGCMATGPFPLGDRHGTADVMAALANPALRWFETAHFRIGCDLPPCALPEDERERARLLAECRDLRRVLPAVPARPRALDGWLRLHLHARRLEQVYDRVCALAGVDDDWFADHPRSDLLGDGRFLGSDDKFVVLLFARESDLARYLRTFCEVRADRPWRQRYERTRNWLFATSAESCRGELADPVVIDAHVVWFVAQNLLDSFVGDGRTPFWWREGLAHVLAHEVADQVVTITDLPEDERAHFAGGDWEGRARGLLANGLLPPLDAMLSWRDGAGRSPTDHVALWSWVDWLCRQDRAAVAQWFQAARQQPFPAHARDDAPRLRWHEERFTAAFGRSRAALQQAWHASMRARPVRR